MPLLVLAQTQDAPPETVIRINVNLVQVDAVVTDSKGKPVTDLTARDFEILQDGKPQVITNFSYINTRPAAAAAPVAAPPQTKGTVKAPPVPPAKLKPSDIRRTFALVVDDLGLSFDSIAHVRQALKKFVDQEMQPGDLVAIIRTGAGIGALQQFTADKRQLYAAIDRVKFNAVGRVGIGSFAPLGSEPDLGSDDANDFRDRSDATRNEIFAVGTLGAIGYVVNGLRELPGRKAVVLFSENMQLFNPNDGMSDRVRENMRHLVDSANRSSVVVYSIDPRGLQYTGITAADNTRGMSAEQIAAVSGQRSEQEFRSQDGLVMLASETGGLFLHNTNDIGGAVHTVVEDSEGYYLIGYHPDAATFDAKTGQPRFHRVSVRLKKPGLHVRSRTGFFGTSDREHQAVAHTRDAEIAHALTSPFGSGTIHVRLTPLFTQAPKQGSYLNTMLYIEPKDLKFTDEPEGKHKAVIDVVAITFGDNGQAVDQTARTYTLDIPDKAYQDVLKNGLVYKVTHPVKKPGAYQMRVVVRDATSEQVGSANQFIEVPDVSKGRLTLSSLLIQEAPSEAAPQTPEHPEGQVPDPNPLGSVAVRVFKPGKAIVYSYQVLNAQFEEGKKPDLEVHTRLFRDGTPVYTGKPAPITPMTLPDSRVLLAGGSMKFGDKITPGDYVLQVIVTDKLAKEKSQTASTWMDFEIQQ